MKLSIALAYSLISFCLLSCGSQKKDSAGENGMRFAKAENNNNYKPATLFINEDSNCPIILILDKTSEYLDPVNIDQFGTFENETHVLVEYQDSRQMNRCNMARPIIILNIKKREAN